MTNFFLADYNLYFTVAIAFVLILSLIEGLGLIIGLSLMSALDQLTPFELDVDAEIDVTGGGLTSVLGWLCLHRLPLLIWLVVFCASFGLFGYILNYVTQVNFDYLLPSYVAYSLAVIFAIYATKGLSKPLAKVLPKNETSAVSQQSLVGLIGKVTVGKAALDNPAEAVFTDQFNQKHYLLVAPETEEHILLAGSEVVLVEKLEKHWIAIPFKQ